MTFINWLKDSWSILVAVIGGITLVWTFCSKTLKEIKTAVIKPFIDVNDKLDAVQTSVNEVEEKLDDHIKKSGEEDAINIRNRILRFSDEIIIGQEHTKEHYRDVLLTIDQYEKYCIDHPEFPNNRCLIAIENIKEEYKEKCRDNSFVTIERLTQVINKEG